MAKHLNVLLTSCVLCREKQGWTHGGDAAVQRGRRTKEKTTKEGQVGPPGEADQAGCADRQSRYELRLG